MGLIECNYQDLMNVLRQIEFDVTYSSLI